MGVMVKVAIGYRDFCFTSEAFKVFREITSLKMIKIDGQKKKKDYVRGKEND